MKVALPLHLKWSGPREYDLEDHQHLLLVYETVMREGGAADIATYIDPAEVARLWDELVLPAGVRAAWRAYLELHHDVHLPE